MTQPDTDRLQAHITEEGNEGGRVKLVLTLPGGRDFTLYADSTPDAIKAVEQAAELSGTAEYTITISREERNHDI